jgi:hypothetical protein
VEKRPFLTKKMRAFEKLIREKELIYFGGGDLMIAVCKTAEACDQ